MHRALSSNNNALVTKEYTSPGPLYRRHRPSRRQWGPGMIVGRCAWGEFTPYEITAHPESLNLAVVKPIELLGDRLLQMTWRRIFIDGVSCSFSIVKPSSAINEVAHLLDH